MLTKLIRYEFRATRRMFIPAFLVVLVLSIANGISLQFCTENMSLPSGLLLTIYILSLFSVCVLAFVYMIERFYTNLLGDEGYLMFTLPARPSQLIWSKCIVSSIWFILTGIVCSISLVLMVTVLAAADGSFSMFFQGLHYGLQAIFQFNINPLYFILCAVELFVLSVVYIVNFNMHIYACLSIGSLSNKHRLLVAFLAYLAFGVIQQILVILFSGLSGILHIPMYSITNWMNTVNPSTAFQFSMLSAFILVIITTAVYFIITNYILSKRLNLQ